MPRKVLITKDTLQEILEKYQGGGSSSGGGSGGIDTIIMTTSLQSLVETKLVFNFIAGELVAHKDELNTGIQAINTQAGTSIPLMTDLDSLSDILDYLNTLNNDTIYNNAMNGFFSWLSNYCISSGARLNTNGVSTFTKGFLGTSFDVDPNSGYHVITVTEGENSVSLDGGGSGSINGTADGEDGSGNPISLSVNGTADVSVSVSGNVPSASNLTWASARLNTKFSSLTVVQGSSSSGGSGTSDVLYKHVVTGITYTDNSEQEPVTLSFLSKYSTPWTTDGNTLLDFFQYYSGLNDEHGFINPMVIVNIGGNDYYFIVNSVVPTNSGIVICSQTQNGGYFDMSCEWSNNGNITDTVTPYIQVSGGSGSSVELPKYYEVSIYVSSQNSGSNEKMLFNITESNLNIFIDEANQQLSPMGYTLTKDNWSTLIPQLGTASSQLRHALIKGLLTLSNNASAEDIDGYSNMICVYADGVIKLGFDQGSYTTIESSSIRLITNHF